MALIYWMRTLVDAKGLCPIWLHQHQVDLCIIKLLYDYTYV